MRKVYMLLLSILIFILSIAIMYLGADAILSRIQVSSNVSSAEEDVKYDIYLFSNDVHTDLVFPVNSDIIDWRNTFPTQDILSKDSTYQYVGIGWGDKGFYLNTPEWKDLKAKTALVAALGIGETALHVTYYHNMTENNLCYKISISKEQYEILVNYVLESLETKADKRPIYIDTDAQYGDSDAFYEALGSYSMFYSCNTWTNEALKKAGLPAAKWTVFDKGILRHYGYRK